MRHFSASGPGAAKSARWRSSSSRVLALEHRDQERPHAAEVVVDERERDAGLLGDGAVLCRRAPPEQHLARRVEDPRRVS